MSGRSGPLYSGEREKLQSGELSSRGSLPNGFWLLAFGEEIETLCPGENRKLREGMRRDEEKG